MRGCSSGSRLRALRHEAEEPLARSVVRAAEVVEEDAADAARLVPVLDHKVAVAPDRSIAIAGLAACAGSRSIVCGRGTACAFVEAGVRGSGCVHVHVHASVHIHARR